MMDATDIFHKLFQRQLIVSVDRLQHKIQLVQGYSVSSTVHLVKSGATTFWSGQW